MTKGDIKYFLNEDVGNIFDNGYVTEVLGINTTLNEGYSVDTKREVLQEQLLLEGWWDDLKDVKDNLKGVFTTIGKAVTNPKVVNKWVKGLEIHILTHGINTIEKFLLKVVTASEKFGLDTIKKLAQGVGSFIIKLRERIGNFSGWAGAITLTGIALSIQFVLNKARKMFLMELVDMSKDWLINVVKDKLTTLLTPSLEKGIETIINGFSGVGALVKWAVRAFESAAFIGTALKPIVNGVGLSSDDTDIYLGRKRENMNIVKNLLKENLHLESSLDDVKDGLDFSAFKMNDTLNPYFWKSEDEIGIVIKKNLLKIANDYWDSLELDFDYLDISITGSIANFNWSKYSDVDLHIIFDMDELGDDAEMIKELLDVKTRKWNDEHNITVKGFDVELYLQPEDQPHHSTGVYSLLNDEWVTKPEKQVVKLDKENIRKKYKGFASTVDDIKSDLKSGKNYIDIIDRLDRLKDKIGKMRKAGLEDSGEFSVENIVFKLLRRNDIMDIINRMLTKAYDTSVTVDEEYLFEFNEDSLVEDYPTEFDLEKFKTLTSWAAKQRYAQEHLGKPIGRGSSRVVYNIDGTKVLKLAKNEKGLKQNETEIDLGSQSYNEDVLAKVFDYDKENHLWVEMELARRAKKSDFKKEYGFVFWDFARFMVNYSKNHNGEASIFYLDKELEEQMYENEFVMEVAQFMVDSDSLAGDIGTISSWGVVKRDGLWKLVLIDFGITHEIYQDYYA